MPKTLQNYIGGQWVDTQGGYIDVVNPALDQVIAKSPKSTLAEVDQAVAAAKAAFWNWRNTPATRRAICLFNLRNKLYEHKRELAEIMVAEHGKTLSDALGELTRSYEYVEFTCGIPELMKGSYSEDVARKVDTHFIREPLGPFLILPPFNFPAMIALYFCWPVACGDTVVIKSATQTPMTINRIVELATECGFPPGVINLVGCGRNEVHRLLTHPDMVGVTFVGSSQVGEIVYKTATGACKRAQVQGGAKNHLVINSDCPIDANLDNIIGSCYGNSSQRCFAGSNLLVHEAVYDEFLQKFLAAAQAQVLGNGMTKGVTMGPVVSRGSLESALGFVERAEREGAKVLLDGRNPSVPECPQGYFLAPTLIEAEPHMEVWREEVFAPVRCIKKIKDLSEAVAIINASQFGHTAVIYTENGGQARDFVRLCDTGQIGINVGTPAPIAFYPVGGRRTSFYGDLRGRAGDAVDFYTDKKVVVTRWTSAIEMPQAALKAEGKLF
ncbi:MAG: aldehyde dehydrogenase family protein [Desulfarculus sp.]|nr:aldehyde dehydrogenase family protein [Desulfarculus sp.]